MSLNIVIFGLSITSSWGNGHATTYRALSKGLQQRGHTVTFLERDVPWYRAHRDLPHPPYCRTELYGDLREVSARYTRLVSSADLVMIGSYVPNGALLADWITMHAKGVTAFYDIDTPITLARLEEGNAEYITAALIPRFDLYLSFTGGPALELIERLYGSPRARAFCCSVDPDLHRPEAAPLRWSLGYLGTYCGDRQEKLSRLLIEPARRLSDSRFAVAGARYPGDIAWPANVERIEHVPPGVHSAFYCAQRYTLNITRADMVDAGFSPSVRLFEAAACGVPVISDRWPGLDSIFKLGEEILIADRPEDVMGILQDIPEQRRLEVAAAARKRVLGGHTAQQRARQLELYIEEVGRRSAVRVPAGLDSRRARIDATA